MQFVVNYTVVVDVEEEAPELIYTEAMNLMDQGFGMFDYEERVAKDFANLSGLIFQDENGNEL